MSVILMALFMLVFEQHSPRTNKVWTMNVLIKSCQINITEIKQGIWDEEIGANLQRVPIGQSTIQWSIDVPLTKEGKLIPTYKIADLLSEMAQTTYLYEIKGTTYSGEKFLQLLWASPLGLAKKPIEKAPLRYEFTTDWDEDEEAQFRNWFRKNHDFTNNKLWNIAEMFSKKMDVRMDVTLTLGTNDCTKL